MDKSFVGFTFDIFQKMLRIFPFGRTALRYFIIIFFRFKFFIIPEAVVPLVEDSVGFSVVPAEVPPKIY